MLDINKLTILQQNLNDRKYFESINQNKNMSGKMDYCQYCALRGNDCCCASQNTIDDLRQCATSYINMYPENRLLYEEEVIKIKKKVSNGKVQKKQKQN